MSKQLFSFRETLFEGFSANDYVYNYFQNKKAVIPNALAGFALLARDLKRNAEKNDKGYHEAKNKMVDAWQELLGFSINKSEQDCLDFAIEIFDSIPNEE